MKRFGLLQHPDIVEAQTLAETVEGQLAALGVSVWRASARDDEQIVREARGSDLVITFGGDGTIVHTARVTAGLKVPILGVNFGRLGFLAALQPSEVTDNLEALVNGRYRLQERMMLHAELMRGQQVVRSFEALNDVVVGRGRIARLVRIDVSIDGEYVANYVADGVIVSTPTGSTAYSLAAGGPVVDPRLQDLLITPIAPHLCVDRALVLPGTAKVHLAVSPGYEATCTVDGQTVEVIGDSDAIVVGASQSACRFVRLGENTSFYRTLFEKLG
jgi:NAD+ kinase